MGALRARVAVALALAGCGHGTAAPPRPPVVTPPAREDLSLELGETALTGVRFVPEAIVAPSMLLVHGHKTPTLDKQRAAWARLRNDRKAVARKVIEGQLLATSLFEAARTDPARRLALLAEARAVIAAIHAATPGTTDDTTLAMEVALAFATDDAAAAQPALTELVQRFGDRPTGTMARTQLAFARLRDGEDAIATALLSAREPSASDPELAYVIAWTRWRGGDGPGAAVAITLAAQGWRNAASSPAVDGDFVLMHARSGLPLETTADAVAAVAADAARRAALWSQLAAAYAVAGYPREAGAALDAALAAQPASPAMVVQARLLQAEYTRRAGNVEGLATAWAAATAALAACPSCGADDRRAVGDGVAARAVEAHTIFATAGDARYRAAAAALYTAFDALPGVDERTDRGAMRQAAIDFTRVSEPADGAQYKDALKGPMAVRQYEVLACYEATLQGTPALGGELTLTLEIDRAGAVIGVATDPPRGAEGMARVAACVEERARAWVFPGRPRPGSARVTARYVVGAKP